MLLSVSMFARMPLCRIAIILFFFPINVSDKSLVDSLTDLEVIKRWRTIYVGPDIIQRFVNGEKCPLRRNNKGHT
ncbi:MAG: hypothetical protein OFPII_13730 [Osedax symbiont Rs1]|nr:MAG: hypothetical protein OFPII_13730 [Osedax symbiont Rs1]